MTSHDITPIRRRLAMSLINLITRPTSDEAVALDVVEVIGCLLYTSPSPRDS